MTASMTALGARPPGDSAPYVEIHRIGQGRPEHANAVALHVHGGLMEIAIDFLHVFLGHKKVAEVLVACIDHPTIAAIEVHMEPEDFHVRFAWSGRSVLNPVESNLQVIKII